MADIELFEKLESKRASYKSDFDWKKIEAKRSNAEKSPTSSRRKASALQIIGN